MEVELLAIALHRRLEQREVVERTREVRERLRIGRLRDRAGARAAVIGDRLSRHPGRVIVVRHDLGLPIGEHGELGLDHRCDPLVVLLSRGAQQRLVRDILDEGVLEHIPAVVPTANRIFGRHQLREAVSQRALVDLGDRRQQIVR